MLSFVKIPCSCPCDPIDGTPALAVSKRLAMISRTSPALQPSQSRFFDAYFLYDFPATTVPAVGIWMPLILRMFANAHGLISVRQR